MKYLKITKNEQYYAEKLLDEMKPGTTITVSYDKDLVLRIYKTTNNF